jgi:acyl-CoA synthetase (AMP-forming)/AMP-acid ligase II
MGSMRRFVPQPDSCTAAKPHHSITSPGTAIRDYAVGKRWSSLRLTVRRLCELQHIARFKRPKSYVVETELAKNNYGKVLKTELRARLAAAKTDLEEV